MSNRIRGFNFGKSKQCKNLALLNRMKMHYAKYRDKHTSETLEEIASYCPPECVEKTFYKVYKFFYKIKMPLLAQLVAYTLLAIHSLRQKILEANIKVVVKSNKSMTMYLMTITSNDGAKDVSSWRI